MNKREIIDAAVKSIHLLEFGIIKILPPRYLPKATNTDFMLSLTDALSILLEVWMRLFTDNQTEREIKATDSRYSILLLKELDLL